MASSNMKDIKRRIKSVESIMQITKAMELVASSKLRKAKEKADKARPFFDALYDTMCEIYSETRDFSSAFTKIKQIKTVLLVVIAGDRGFAGSFNNNVLKLALSRAKELSEQGVRVKILAVGKKADEYFEKRGFEIIESLSGISETIKIYGVKAISDRIVNRFLAGEFEQVELFYTTFLNALSQEARGITMLPVNLIKKDGGSKVLTEYDPSPEAVFDSIIPKYISGLLFGAIADSFAAEQAARRTAMESASDNASEMIDSLSLAYNRARQSSITQEITEIIGGAQAQA